MLPGPQLPAHTASRPGQLRFGRGCERGALLVVDVHPVDAALGRPPAAAHGVAERVEAVADQPVDAMHPRLYQHVEQVIGHTSRHVAVLSYEVTH